MWSQAAQAMPTCESPLDRGNEKGGTKRYRNRCKVESVQKASLRRRRVTFRVFQFHSERREKKNRKGGGEKDLRYAVAGGKKRFKRDSPDHCVGQGSRWVPF